MWNKENVDKFITALNDQKHELEKREVTNHEFKQDYILMKESFTDIVFEEDVLKQVLLDSDTPEMNIEEFYGVRDVEFLRDLQNDLIIHLTEHHLG
jgi:hypothetical protein